MTFYREMMAMTFYRELSQTFGSEPAGDLTIKTGKLIVQDGAQVSADTFSQGDGGKLTVLASDSVELSGKSTLADGREVQSGLFSVASGGSQVASRFTVTGRGGLPDNPSETLSSNAVWTDLRPNLNFSPFAHLSDPVAK